MSRIPNVIVFGATGSGKSSVINMVGGGREAFVSSGSAGATFATECYTKQINGRTVNLYDTAGLNEALRGTVSPRQALDSLYQLTRKLESDGIDLLVFVVRAPRITELVQQNYDMFYDILCHGSVPIALVVTGLEAEPDMDRWWTENKANFDRHRMFFGGQACITAIRGPLRRGGHVYDALYTQSQRKVARLIIDTLPATPWLPPKNNWFISAAERSLNVWASFLHTNPVYLLPDFKKALASYGAVLGTDTLSQRHHSSVALGHSAVPNVVVIGPDSNRVHGLLVGTRGSGHKPFQKERTRAGAHDIDLYKIPSVQPPSKDAQRVIERAYTLFHHQLMCNVQLVVFAIKKDQVMSSPGKDYQLLSLISDQVPVVLVVTGEFVQERERWWRANRQYFDEKKMRFHGRLLLSEGDTTERQRRTLEELVESSRSQMASSSTLKPGLVAVFLSWFSNGFVLAPRLRDTLMSVAGLSKDSAVRLSNRTARHMYFGRL